jgi:Arc/MetJ family transcription regulator
MRETVVGPIPGISAPNKGRLDPDVDAMAPLKTLPLHNRRITLTPQKRQGHDRHAASKGTAPCRGNPVISQACLISGRYKGHFWACELLIETERMTGYDTPLEVYMRTNIVLDDRLIKQAMRLAKVKTKREAVDLALRDFVARSKQRDILELIGQDLIAPDYDVRAVRRAMNRDPG